MATLDHISGAEPSTVTFKLRTVRFNQNSSNMHSEVMVLGDPDSTNAIAAVLNAVPASTAWGIVVRKVGDSTSFIKGDSTAFQGGTWIVRANLSSTSADNPVSAAQAGTWTVGGASTVAPLAGSTWNTRPVQSSAADLQMTATPAAGSTWRTQPGSTLWASSAGFHFDSSGGLQISGTITAGGSTGPLTISQLLDSSGGSVTAADSANNAIRVNVVAGAAGGSTIVTVSTGSVRVHQSTAADFQATVTPASSAWQVQVSNGNSSVTITAIAAGAGRLNIGSTAADNAVLVSGNSTVSPLAGSLWTIQGNSTVAPLAGSTWATRPIQSSQADLRMTAYQSTAADFNATVSQAGTWTVNLGTHLQSSVVPSSNSSGIVVRQAMTGGQVTASTNAFASTSLAIGSSAASRRNYVTAYSITTTNAGPTKIGFYSSNTLLWPIVLAAVSSAVSGVNLAVSPPAYLFKTNASEALSLRTKGSTIAGWVVGVAYYQAP